MVPRPNSTVPSNILILSHPRSGSSWLGSTMANSPIVDYRREPVLQSRLGHVQDAFGSSIGLTDDERRGLRQNIDQAFTNRTKPVVLVKEVTPLLIDDFLEAVDPQVIYLQRHPLAVAQSHISLGWLPHRRLLLRDGIGEHERETLHTLWESGTDIVKLVGYLAAVDSSVRDTLEQSSAITITYEALSAGVLGAAAPLFDALGVDASDLSAPLLDADRPDEYGVGEARRSTPAEVLGPDTREESKAAWLAFGPASYSDESDWMPGAVQPNDDLRPMDHA